LSGIDIPMRFVIHSARWRGSRSRLLRFIVECVLGLAAVLLVAWVAPGRGGPLPDAVWLSFPIVLLVAWLCGLWQAAILALAAVVIADSMAGSPAMSYSLAALVTFILTAVLVSRSSKLAARKGKEAENWSSQTRDLYEFTRRTLQIDLHVEPGPQLAEMIQEIFKLQAVAVFDADLHTVYQAGSWKADPQEEAQSVYHFGTSDDDAALGLVRRVVRLGSVPVGSLIMRGDITPLAAHAIASLIAITFDRFRAIANESLIETARRTEQLRATVLDSLAHAYKTPLTAIRAASTGLSEMGRLSVGQAELVALIDEQTSLLNDLTTRLLTTARLDAGEVAVHAEPVNAGALLDEVLMGLKDRLAGAKVAVELENEDLVTLCDRRLMIMLLTQYLDNACKYSHFGSAITLRVASAPTETIFSVHSYGQLIPMADRERIFDRYYRSSTSNQTPGTGIGLSVAKRVATIHGGYVWVTSDEQEGTTFFAAIPAGKEKGNAR
jgi:two-component system, OmpR family, sensor histidine kinase KdpD